jgi:hypothetical protein
VTDVLPVQQRLDADQEEGAHDQAGGDVGEPVDAEVDPAGRDAGDQRAGDGDRRPPDLAAAGVERHDQRQQAP